ncbi:R2-like ligand-binding oxidase [Alicyclobacillus tolerans]|uniref:R2-like ligand-binding oxidase n=1 Tax=Alicyclobacillus tolerans TaxID=90970 RepID=UPI001F21390A|nr:R2-like ligand-binding oxidase [Alicyclobacillus tolerans]MCF8563805.1 R2-like ligand-binding oxidase [Alicyclobacillus tolerans]
MRTEIVTTSARGLRQDSLPFRLYQKAKRLGTWDPRDIDFTQDIQDWASLTENQRRRNLRLISMFQAGEEAVTLDLLPLIMVIAKEGRLEEEMFLTTFLFEEAKHTEFFRLLLDTLGEKQDLSHMHSDTYKKIFYELLPDTMQALVHDQSPEAVADASTMYNMFIEGVLAETGYYSFYQGLNRMGKMPGLIKGVDYLKRDESRHIGYGTFLLQRLICEHPHLYERVEKKMNDLAPLAVALNQEGTVDQEEGDPMNVDLNEVMQFSMKQLSLRLEKIARARENTVEELYKISEEALGVL